MCPSVLPARFVFLLTAVAAGLPPAGADARDIPFIFLIEPVFIDGIGLLQFEPTHFYRFVDSQNHTLTVLVDVGPRDEAEQNLGRISVVNGNRLRARRRLDIDSVEESAVIRYLESAIDNFWDERSATNLEDDRTFMARGLFLLKTERARRDLAAKTGP